MSIVKHSLIGASGQGGYDIERSLRFRSSASAYLYRTPASAGNQKTWTWSGWVKRGQLSSSANFELFSVFDWAGGGATNKQHVLRFTDDKLSYFQYDGGYDGQYLSTQVFRDPSAWYHIVAVWNTPDATASDRMKLYVNGERITSFTTANNPTQNIDGQVNRAFLHTQGTFYDPDYSSPVNNFDGYLTEINFIDGQALDPTDFGETDTITGVWKPKKYTGTYGTNGFFLNFKDPTSTVTLCADQSGTGNNWTAANISLSSGTTYDSMQDVPTLTSLNAANFCTLNPLDADSSISITEGNLKATASTATHNNARSTISCGASGYFYAELTYGSTVGGSTAFAWGLYSPTFRIDNGTHPVSASSGFYGLYASASSDMYTNGSTGSSVTVSTGSVGDVLQLAYDVAGGNLWFGKNNVWYDSSGGTTGDPSTGTNPTITSVETDRIFGFDIVSNTLYFNFGQRPFAYTPPTGFKKLNTYNLPDSTIEDGSEQFNTVTYSGTGSSLSIPVGFIPDFTWIKRRNAANNHQVFDVLRGSNVLVPNETGDESDYSLYFDFSDTDGFDLPNASVNMNNSSGTYVSWNWKANGSGVLNEDGTIDSTVSVNTTAGFSIAAYTSDGASTQTFGHGLGVTPDFVIIKARDRASERWRVWHQSLATNGYINLNETTAASTASTIFQTASITSSVIAIGNNASVGLSGTSYICYAFAGVEGFSNFGGYTGNGSADGPFIYTGFRPAWLLMKRIDSTSSWYINDSIRSPDNDTTGEDLYPNLNNAEGGTVPIDILSNGFKLRNSNNSRNASGGQYVYAAFAENPFKNALAR